MTLWEWGESSGEVCISQLFCNSDKVDGENPLSIEDVAYVMCRGGWPKSLNKKTQKGK